MISSWDQEFLARNLVKLVMDRWIEGELRALTIEEVWASFPNLMNPVTKEVNNLKEGLEKLLENKDNMNCRSAFAFLNLISCPPFWAVLKLFDLISLL
jgi:hypothetical protein